MVAILFYLTWSRTELKFSLGFDRALEKIVPKFARCPPAPMMTPLMGAVAD